MDEFKQRLLELIDRVHQEEKILIDRLTDEERSEAGSLDQAVRLNPVLIKRSTEDPDLPSIRDQSEKS